MKKPISLLSRGASACAAEYRAAARGSFFFSLSAHGEIPFCVFDPWPMLASEVFF